MALLRYDDTDAQTAATAKASADTAASAASAAQTAADTAKVTADSAKAISDAALAQAQAAAAIAASIPQPAAATPPATALDGALGTGVKFAREDHTHAARVQRTAMITAADGTVTWTFARPIVCGTGKVPPISNMVEDTGSPVVVQISGRTFTSAGGFDTHTAVSIKAQRSQALPATLLTLANLVSFNVFGIAAAGVKVNLFAADPTQ